MAPAVASQFSRADHLVRAAVERKLEIVRETLNRLGREGPELAARIPDIGCIVASVTGLAVLHGQVLVRPSAPGGLDDGGSSGAATQVY